MTSRVSTPWLRFDFRCHPLLESSSARFSDAPQFFANPERIVVARRVEEVVSALEAVQNAVAAGNYAAGYIGYEAAPAFDAAMQTQCFRNDMGSPFGDFPLLWFGIFTQPSSGSEAISSAELSSLEPESASCINSEWQSSQTREAYEHNIEKIREAIANGETYQVNYTLRLRTEVEEDTYAWYERLLQASEAGYGAYLDMGRYRILSVSPELFFHRRGSRIVTRPMKGTMSRGRWREEDEAQEQALRASEKNRAENIMIVDLLRNDLGRLAILGSVRVSDLFALERYPTVWQMTSTVEAEIPEETSVLDIFRALFPCGSVTGAPKIQTMRHIAALEDSPRHIYCGAIGVIAPDGTATFNVAIRTLLVDTRHGVAEYGVGGGITWDSNATDEYAEIQAKASVLHSEIPVFGLLETLRLENGYIRTQQAHLKRMSDSAAYFGFPNPAKVAKQALYRVAREHRNGSWRVRLRFSAQGEAAIEVFPLEPNKDTPYLVMLAETPVDSTYRFLYHKTTHRDVYAQHRRVMEARGGDLYDVLLWNEREELTEFTTGNLVIRLQGAYLTPPRNCGLLAGVARAEVLAEREIQEHVLTREDLKQAMEIWLINSVRGWLPVRIAGL